MNILYPAAYFQPESMAFSHLEHDLLTAFTEAGHEIDVICPLPTRGVSEAVRRKYRGIRSETLYGGHVHVHRFWAPQEGRNPVVRAFRYFWCNLREYSLGKRFTGTDVIFTASTPPTQGLLAGRLKKKLGCGAVYSLQDVFPDSLVNTGLSRKGSLLWKIGRRVEDAGYRGVDAVAVISEGFKRNLLDKGVPEDKLPVIPNWVDEQAVVFVPRAENVLFDRYGLDRSKFYIAYSGNIGHTQNMDLLLDVAKSLRDHPAIGFLIVGDGAAREQVAQRVEQEEILNVTLLPFQPYEEISQVFSLGDVGLLISKAGIGGNSVPSKTWSYFSAQRPVLASFDRDSELARLIEENRCGISIPPDDAPALRNAILQMYAQSDALSDMGEHCRSYILNNLTKAAATGRYLTLLEQVAGVGSGEPATTV